MNDSLLLVANGFLHVPAPTSPASASAKQRAHLGTVLANLASYGYAPSIAALEALRQLELSQLKRFWREVEPALQRITGADRRMADFVVYKNFPDEVLSMSQAGYWIRQISMYLGAPNEWFTQEAAERPMLDERLALKVLDLAGTDAFDRIAAALTASRFRWTDLQRDHALQLLGTSRGPLDLGAFGFKENGIRAIAASLDHQREIHIRDATDVLRLAAALSDADISLRGDVKFARFSRARRRQLVTMLEAAPHLDEDFGARPHLFKHLLSRLHPGDFQAPRVSAAYDRLYRGLIETHNARIERLLQARDEAVLDLVVERPGEAARRLHQLYTLFGSSAVDRFCAVAERLPTARLLQLRKYAETINDRATLMHPPRGAWARARIMPNEKQPLGEPARAALLGVIDKVVSARLASALPHGVVVDPAVAHVKLPTNDQELAPYGRGTRFPIPPEVTLVRTASYWRAKTTGGGNIWYDNGWVFLTGSFQPVGAVCWNLPRTKGAAFSGDPTNSKDSEGRACQLIDLDLKALNARGVRYAVWNVLAYNRIKFSAAEEVCAALQWGEDARAGGLFEAARAQMVFPLKGDALTKYVAYLDLHTRELVYMDADLGGAVNAASSNQERLSSLMPAYLEYLASLPSVADLFATAPKGDVPVLYSDEGVDLPRGQCAYVFQRRNAANDVRPLELAGLLGAADAVRVADQTAAAAEPTPVCPPSA
ncbi:hypothetical protein OOT46_09115 [Aquabacterium sp. A7-Y]|uniref:hypothetical protein n=1 Tax=Aquabacterium sp. A7-Y TaxID=1349605 RepID=UPI00223E2661|nr:hypothetical protein [Aquabacterium sp. A7-Y]MCW7538007.1 hypothetical protein [Aquabacterium sp. A7-Y]